MMVYSTQCVPQMNEFKSLFSVSPVCEPYPPTWEEIVVSSGGPDEISGNFWHDQSTLLNVIFEGMTLQEKMFGSELSAITVG